MAKHFVQGSPEELRGLVPAGSTILVSEEVFMRAGVRFTLVSCKPAAGAEPGGPAEACSARLRQTFASRKVVAYADFVDDEAPLPPLF